MILDDVLKLFEEKVFSTSVNRDLLFNQYNEKNSAVDLPNADEIRRGNLKNYLRSFEKRPSVIVIGEAPGWRGCRFSGVPFTSEAQLCDGSLPFKGFQSSNNRLPYKENAATIFWQYMSRHHSEFFAWNCVPFHPHESGDWLSNRTPSKKEIADCLKLLSGLVSLIRPNQIVAIGRSAEHALKDIKNGSFIYVRHPSHGGANEFRAGMDKVFG